MNIIKDPTKLSDEDLFFEWKDWFTYYRNAGEIPENEREYFRKLSAEMRKRNLVSKTYHSDLIE